MFKSSYNIKANLLGYMTASVGEIIVLVILTMFPFSHPYFQQYVDRIFALHKNIADLRVSLSYYPIPSHPICTFVLVHPRLCTEKGAKNKAHI